MKHMALAIAIILVWAASVHAQCSATDIHRRPAFLRNLVKQKDYEVGVYICLDDIAQELGVRAISLKLDLRKRLEIAHIPLAPIGKSTSTINLPILKISTLTMKKNKGFVASMQLVLVTVVKTLGPEDKDSYFLGNVYQCSGIFGGPLGDCHGQFKEHAMALIDSFIEDWLKAKQYNAIHEKG